MAETWKDIEGYDGLYKVSNLGNVISFHKNKGLLKSIFIKTNGYCKVSLNKNSNEKCFYVHRLVALSFIPNENNKTDVNHKNGNKLDNTLSNLEWCTKSENTQHAYDNGFMNVPKGEKHRSSKLTIKDVYEIRKIGRKLTLSELSQMYGVNLTNIRNILIGKIWKTSFNTGCYESQY